MKVILIVAGMVNAVLMGVNLVLYAIVNPTQGRLALAIASGFVMLMCAVIAAAIKEQ